MLELCHSVREGYSHLKMDYERVTKKNSDLERENLDLREENTILTGSLLKTASLTNATVDNARKADRELKEMLKYIAKKKKNLILIFQQMMIHTSGEKKSCKKNQCRGMKEKVSDLKVHEHTPAETSSKVGKAKKYKGSGKKKRAS